MSTFGNKFRFFIQIFIIKKFDNPQFFCNA